MKRNPKHARPVALPDSYFAHVSRRLMPLCSTVNGTLSCSQTVELGRRDGLCYYHGKIADALMADLVHTSTHAKPTPREEIA